MLQQKQATNLQQTNRTSNKDKATDAPSNEQQPQADRVAREDTESNTTGHSSDSSATNSNPSIAMNSASATSASVSASSSSKQQASDHRKTTFYHNRRKSTKQVAKSDGEAGSAGSGIKNTKTLREPFRLPMTMLMEDEAVSKYNKDDPLERSLLEDDLDTTYQQLERTSLNVK